MALGSPHGLTGALCLSALWSSEGLGLKGLSHLVGTRDLCHSDRVQAQLFPWTLGFRKTV